MFDLAGTPEEFLEPIARVLDAALPRAPGLRSEDVMVVGAACRDILHHALDHRFPTSATHDLDLALTLSSWNAYRILADAFPKVGHTGIRFRIAGTTVDLLPFGDIEDPEGEAQPPTRSEPFSVWAFEEIFAAAQQLILPTGAGVKIPTVAGYAAAKLGAWLDRSVWLEVKDARDLALTAYWYEHSPEVHDRLYDTDPGNSVLVAEQADVGRAAAHLLGTDIAAELQFLPRDSGGPRLKMKAQGVPDRSPHFKLGRVLRSIGKLGPWHPKIGAEHVDTRLTLFGPVVSQLRHGVDTGEADRCLLMAKLASGILVSLSECVFLDLGRTLGV